MFEEVTLVKHEVEDVDLDDEGETPAKKFRFAELLLKEEFIDEINEDGSSKNIFNQSTDNLQSAELERDCLALDPFENSTKLENNGKKSLEEKYIIKAGKLAGASNILGGNKYLILTQHPTTSSGTSNGTRFAQPILLNLGVCGQNLNNKQNYQTVPTIKENIVEQQEQKPVVQKTDAIEDPIRVEKSTYDLDLLTFLRNDANGKGILTVYKNKNNTLTPTARKSLVHILIQREKDEVLKGKEPGDILPDWDIPSSRWIQLAKEIEELFPSELKEVYYSPFSVVNGAKVLASGKLLDHFYYVKRIMRDQGVLAINVKRRKQEETEKIPRSLDKSQERDLEFLKNNSEPFDQVKLVFHKTLQSRRNISKIKNISICQYLLSIKALRLDEEGQALIHLEFNALYSTKKWKLLEKWPKIRDYLIDVLRREAKSSSPEDSHNINSLMTLSSDKQDVLIFYLLHYITTKVHGKKKAKDKQEELEMETIRKLTSDEKRRSYFIHVENADDLETSLDVFNSSLKAKNAQPRPIIAVVGPLLNIQKCYVIIDDIKYTPKTFLDAIDLNYKMFHVFDCEYPAFSMGVWKFLQNIIYEMTVPGEKASMQHKLLCGQIQRLCKSSF